MSRVQLTDSAGNALSITSGALLIHEAATNITNSAAEVWNIAGVTNFAVSTSTGTIKNSAGILFGYLGTTGGGQVNFKVSGSELGPMTVSAGVMVTFPAPIAFTSLTASSSVGVYTVFYR
jgi:hypothetical protein